MADNERRSHGVAPALVDLDQFKRVNDSHGPQAGDEVLRAMGPAPRRARVRGSERPGGRGAGVKPGTDDPAKNPAG